jgi:hypothetical protein
MAKVEEDAIIAREVDTLKRRLADPDLDKSRMQEYLLRLVYVEMLGHSASFGYIHAVKLCCEHHLPTKRVGYLAVSLFLDDTHDLLILIINTLQQDLKSNDPLTGACPYSPLTAHNTAGGPPHGATSTRLTPFTWPSFSPRPPLCPPSQWLPPSPPAPRLCPATTSCHCCLKSPRCWPTAPTSSAKRRWRRCTGSTRRTPPAWATLCPSSGPCYVTRCAAVGTLLPLEGFSHPWWHASQDPSVMAAALNPLLDLAGEEPGSFRNLVPSFVNIFKQARKAHVVSSRCCDGC